MSGNSNVDLMVGNRPLSSLRVVDLKQELEKRGLSKSGSKKDLVDRLRLHLQIEKHRDTGASADEEELPNYSVHDELADQNPFIRDYLASQAELFHSQKVVKKLVEEEAKRESETSADEGVDSPMKQPPTLEREESPVTETRRQSRRRIDSQKEDMTGEKLVTTRSSRSRSRENRDESKSEEEKQTEPEKNGEQKSQEEETPEIGAPVPAKLDRSKSRSASRSPVREKSPEKETASETHSDEPCSKDEPEVITESNSAHSGEEKLVEKPVSPKSKENENASPIRETEDRITKANESDDGEEVAVAKVSSEVPTSKGRSPSPTSSSSPVPDNIPEKVTSDAHCKETESDSKVEPEPETKETVEEKELRPDAHKEVEEKRDVVESSPPRSNESREDSKSRGEDEQKSEPEENDDESRGEESPATETSSKTHPSRSSSASRSPVREKGLEKEAEESRAKEIDPKDEPEVGLETISAPKEEKMDVDESSSPRYKSSQKETSYTNNDIAGEEALDYGEEEDDEDRNESDPQEFSWARRSLRFKNKSTFVPPACKWKLEEESKHLVVKTELLNSYYEDIKMVPLEQLKLEERSSDASNETKKEVERKPSISKEEPTEPLPTRTVENVAPTVKRTVSIIPSTKNPVEDTEEADKALTPPRNPPSDVLLITNLVRPFTLIQLKEMLQRTGNLQDIWVDKIKSKCIAKFASQEEAFETRAALHGVCWPNSNPKSLHVDYTTQDNLDEHKAKEGAEQTAVAEKPVSAQPVPVREWDVGKKAEPKSPRRDRKRSRSRSTSRDRSKRSRRSPSPGRRRRSKSPTHERRNRGAEGKEPEPMGKALDELFRKTIATPSIYWLPLTPEQIAEKEELRRKRMLERERRLAELSKMRPR